MTYTLVAPGTLAPGLSGAAAAYPIVLSNVDDACASGAAPIVCAQVYWSTSSASDVVVGRFAIPPRAVASDLRVAIWWRGTTGQTATCTIAGGSDTLALTSTTTTYAGASGVINPVANAACTEFTVSLKVTGAGSTNVLAILVAYEETAIGSGVRDDGVASTASSVWGSPDQAVPSEVVSRAIANLRYQARETPAGLMSLLDDASHTHVRRSATTTSWETVGRWLHPPGDLTRRTYWLSVYMAGATGTPDVTVYLGPFTLLVSGAGWTHTKITAEVPIRATCRAELRRSAGTGTVYLDTAQLMRAAS